MNVSSPPLLLYCFSHAGGSARIFSGWQNRFSPRVQVKPVELPGRGIRYGETPVGDYAALVESLAREVLEDILEFRRRHGNAEYAGFGHSAGGTFNFAVLTRVAQTLGDSPAHCFIAAGSPPHVPKRERGHISDAKLIDELRKLGGTPPEILQEPELLRMFLPILRADFRAFEASSLDQDRRLACPMTLFAAAQDEFAPDIVWGWSRYTSGPVQKVQLPGDHFSLVQSPAEMLWHIRQDIDA